MTIVQLLSNSYRVRAVPKLATVQVQLGAKDPRSYGVRV